MGLKNFFQKAKGFFSRVWSGVKNGYGKVKNFIRNKITPIYNKLQPILSKIPGVNVVSDVVGKILPKVNNVSDDANEALKQGVKYVSNKVNNG